MFSNIETIYQKGNPHLNEDALVTNFKEGIYSVLDGATGLGGLSGAIASGIIRDAMINEEGELLQRILKGNLCLGMKAIEAMGDPSVKELDDIPKYKRSSCGLAAIQFTNSGRSIHYVAAGDCMLFLQYESGEIRQITYDLIDQLDRVSIETAQNQWAGYLSHIDEDPNLWDSAKLNQYKTRIRDSISGILQKNRNQLNTPQGYGIIDGSLEVPQYLESGVIPLLNVKKILLLSDGLKIHSHRRQSIEHEWIYSAKLAFQHGLAHLEKTIMDIELNDPSCYQYPRLKQHDDKSGVLIEL